MSKICDTGIVILLLILVLPQIWFSEAVFAEVPVKHTVGTSKLHDLIREQGFNAFSQPRQIDGLGAIIAFDSVGHESIIASPADDKCLDLSQLSAVELNSPAARIALPHITFGKSLDAGVKLGLKKLFTGRIAIDAALGVSRVDRILLEFVDPVRARITKLSAQNYLKELPNDSACARAIRSPGNLILHTVIGARGLRFQFLEKDGGKASLSVRLLTAIGFEPNVQGAWLKNQSLEFVLPEGQFILFGYRAWNHNLRLGAFSSASVLSELSYEQIEAIRGHAKTRSTGKPSQ